MFNFTHCDAPYCPVLISNDFLSYKETKQSISVTKTCFISGLNAPSLVPQEV